MNRLIRARIAESCESVSEAEPAAAGRTDAAINNIMSAAVLTDVIDRPPALSTAMHVHP
jgi:hypothetical protein